jgi:hypothetical protein
MNKNEVELKKELDNISEQLNINQELSNQKIVEISKL